MMNKFVRYIGGKQNFLQYVMFCLLYLIVLIVSNWSAFFDNFRSTFSDIMIQMGVIITLGPVVYHYTDKIWKRKTK